MLFKQLSFAAIGFLALGATASPLIGSDRDAVTAMSKPEAPATHIIHEQQHSHWIRQWMKRDRVPTRALLPMRVGLMQSNMGAGERHLKKTSDPNSPDYGK